MNRPAGRHGAELAHIAHPTRELHLLHTYHGKRKRGFALFVVPAEKAGLRGMCLLSLAFPKHTPLDYSLGAESFLSLLLERWGCHSTEAVAPPHSAIITTLQPTLVL